MPAPAVPLARQSLFDAADYKAKWLAGRGGQPPYTMHILANVRNGEPALESSSQRRVVVK
jgi:hypothetical protein